MPKCDFDENWENSEGSRVFVRDVQSDDVKNLKN